MLEMGPALGQDLMGWHVITFIILVADFNTQLH